MHFEIFLISTAPLIPVKPRLPRVFLRRGGDCTAGYVGSDKVNDLKVHLAKKPDRQSHILMSKLTSERIYSHCNRVPVLEQSHLPGRGQVSALYSLINWLDPPERSVRIALPCLRHSRECVISRLSVVIIDQLEQVPGVLSGDDDALSLP